MTNEKIGGLDIDFVDICIEDLNKGELVIINECDDITELKEYIEDTTKMKIQVSNRGSFITLKTIGYGKY